MKGYSEDEEEVSNTAGGREGDVAFGCKVHLRLRLHQDVEESVDDEESGTEREGHGGQVAGVSDREPCAHSSDAGEETGWFVVRHVATFNPGRDRCYRCHFVMI